jgi:hypothetical protein
MPEPRKKYYFPSSRRNFWTDSRQTIGICQLAIYRGFGNKPNAGSITSPNALTCIKAFMACRMPQFTKKDTWQFLKRNIGRQCKIGGSRCRLERASTKPQAALSSTCNTSPSRTTAPELLPPGNTVRSREMITNISLAR